MSKSYKLIKKYPGSPELDDVATDQGSQHWYRINNNSGHIVENCHLFPEFWEEIVEKEYEILSFKDKDGVIYTNNGYNSFYKLGGSIGFGECTFDSGQIHSVKRLSDGEIFTVGDKIHYSDIYKDFNIEKIIMNGKEKSRIEFHGKGLFCTLNESPIIKIKQPLFTTEDGVEIFEGDTIHMVEPTNNVYLQAQTLATTTSSIGNMWKLFSTKEKAEEYIIMNKPILSANDCKNLYNEYFRHEKRDSFTNMLKELVKQKLKL